MAVNLAKSWKSMIEVEKSDSKIPVGKYERILKLLAKLILLFTLVSGASAAVANQCQRQENRFVARKSTICERY